MSYVFDNEYGSGWEVPPAAHNLKFPHGEGADAFYSAPSSFKKATERFGRTTTSQAQRFEGSGSYLATRDCGDVPGPGAYHVSNVKPRPASYDRAVSFGAPSRSPERLRHRPLEGADSFYEVRGAFDAPRVVRRGEGFGTSERFSKLNSYILGDESVPGPGSYLVRRPLGGKAPKVVPPLMDKSERLSFLAGEGAEPMYEVKSQFDKYRHPKYGPSATMGTQARFGQYGAEEGPGPGAFNVIDAKRKVSRRTDAGVPVLAPSVRYTEGRLQTSAGESPGPVYKLKGAFDKAGQHRAFSNSFGTSPRFADSEERAPGPGAYYPKTAPVRPRSAAPTFAGPNMRPPGWTAARESARERRRT